jgi:hypothetical protein
MDNISLLKNNISIEDVVAKYVGPVVVRGGGMALEDDACPFHGGSGSFSINTRDGYAKCFGGTCPSEGKNLDIIGFVQELRGVSCKNAIGILAKDFGVTLQSLSKKAQVLYAAYHYYRDIMQKCLDDMDILGGRTPMQYQLEVRHHLESTVTGLQIGWADGALHRHLESEGFSSVEMLEAGVVFENEDGTIRDMVPNDSFVYPHFWEGKVSRLSFKCLRTNRKTGAPLAWQMRKEHMQNGVTFYRHGEGQPTAVVEGENDLATLVDLGWNGTILCTIGQLSRDQVKWMCDNPGEYHTFFDNDDGGEKYRDTIWKAVLTGHLTASQYVVPEVKDIDDYVKGGGSIDLLAPIEPPRREDVVETSVASTQDITVQDGCYAITKVTPDGKEVLHILSNFLIQLMYVKVANDERSRMIRIVRNDGVRSEPVVVNSEAKVSLRHFKILIANAIDAKFKGSEGDLADIWDYVYSRQKEAVVEVPPYVGCTERGGWLFSNQYVGPEGDIVGDADNIMWFNETKSRGIAPKSLLTQLSSVNQAGDIPDVYEGEDTMELLEGVVTSLATIFKDPGPALLYLGWLESCAYSMDMFHKANIGYFPFMLLWGRHGKGKSTVVGWGMALYDMADKGVTTVGQIKSGVGIERKLAYYRGLPFCIDELRADKQAQEFYGTWRGWYNRTTRVKGTRSGESAITVPFNACLMFSGQDIFTDAAMRSRSIPIKFPQNAGDAKAFVWMQDHVDYFPEIGYMWIKEAMKTKARDIKEAISEVSADLAVRCPGIPNRTINNYAIPLLFAKRMRDQFYPDYDLDGYIENEISGEFVEASESDTVNQLWEIISGLQSGDRPMLDSTHIRVKDSNVCVWMAEVFRIVENSNRGKEWFSKTAIKHALREEPYYVGESLERLHNVQRRCMVFRMDGAPENLLAIAEASVQSYG